MELFQKATTCRLQILYCCEIYDCCQGAWGWEVGIRMFSDLSANLAAIERLNIWPTRLAHDEWSYHKTPQAIWIHVGRPFLFLIFFLKCSVSKIKSICRKAGACWKRRGQCASRRLRSYFGELYQVWPYELRWDMFSIFRSGLWVCVFETLLLLKNLG